jgi:hypothetical protein
MRTHSNNHFPTAVLPRMFALVGLVSLAACGGGSAVGISSTQAAGGLALNTASVTVPVTTPTVSLSVNRESGTKGAVTASYSTSNGTASAGTDYTSTSGTLSWADGDATAKTLSVPINTAASFTGAKTFSVALVNTTGGASLKTPSAAMVTITGSASGNAGTLALSASSASVAQSASSYTVTVNRSGGSSGAVAVQYATSNGTAVAGTDYTAASGTLSWADGDAAAKTFNVAISNATPFSGAKTVQITLSSPTGGATLGTASATLTIIGSAHASGLSIGMQGNHFVDAGGNVVQVRGVNLSGLESGIIFTGGTNFWQSSGFSGRPDFSKIAAWKANAVRLPLNEASWLGRTVVGILGNGIALDGAAYQAEVKATVAAANAAGLYVILDLHWTAPGVFAPNTQNPFLNADHSVNFWSSIANAFQGNQAVMFELFNEPFVCPASHGGVCSAPEGVNVNQTLSQGGTENYYIGLSTGTFGGSVTRVPYTYNTVSYQTVINAIRATGAANVIICGGNNYDDDLTWWTQYPPTDPLNKLAAAIHQYPGFYPNNAVTGAAGMNAMMDPIAANHPVIVTELGDEVGSNPAPFATPLLAWADAHGYSVVAWAWNPWGGTNTLIQNSNTYTPTPGLGQTYHDWTFNHQ